MIKKTFEKINFKLINIRVIIGTIMNKLSTLKRSKITSKQDLKPQESQCSEFSLGHANYSTRGRKPRPVSQHSLRPFPSDSDLPEVDDEGKAPKPCRGPPATSTLFEETNERNKPLYELSTMKF